MGIVLLKSFVSPVLFAGIGFILTFFFGAWGFAAIVVIAMAALAGVLLYDKKRTKEFHARVSRTRI